ncbi:MAG: tyrosine-type recombinase/integrase [Anaerotignum sp.]
MASIRKRGDTYQIRVSAGYDIYGKQIIKTKTWKPEAGWTAKRTEKELNKALVQFEDDVLKGRIVVDGSMKFADFSQMWMKEHAEKTLREGTVLSYKKLLVRINAAIGHIKLERLTPLHLMAFYNNLSEEGIKDKHISRAKVNIGELRKNAGISLNEICEYAGISITCATNVCKGKNIEKKTALKIAELFGKPYSELYEDTDNERRLSTATIKNHHVLISSILNSAVQWGYILDNPCRRVSPPKAVYQKRDTLSSDETERMFECLEKEPIKYRAAIVTLVCGGLRRSELCGLKWSDLDMESGVVTVVRKLAYIPHKGLHDDEPKTENGKRAFKLPESALIVLREYKKWQAQNRLLMGDRYDTSGYIFVGDDGRVMHPDALHKWFSDFLKRYDLPPITLHSLRHTNASLLIANGVDLATVSKRLGHANTAITAQIYTHAIMEADARAADVVDNLFLSSKVKKAN